MKRLSVVIPVFNGEPNLFELHKRLVAVLDTACEDFEIIMVDDGSRDQSWEKIVEIVRLDQRVRGVRLVRNFGQHNALLRGIRCASYETIVTMDDDLQHPPEEIPRLLEKLEQGSDVVYGTPMEDRHGLWRDLASKITKLALSSSMGVENATKVSAFRAFRTDVREAFRGYDNPYISIDVLLTWGTTRFSSVKVEHRQRRAGESNYTIKKLMVHALNMITGFSVLPLQLASMLGFFFTLFGVGVLTYVGGRYLIQGSSVPGFPFLASVIAIFSGAQLFALGIIGEYLARIHFRSMGRPYSVVRESEGFDTSEDKEKE